jgi:thiol-disulfide isomerase/thioredoxin
MKYFLLFCLAFSISTLRAQGIEFFHGTWPEALELAKSEEKIIFVDAFASWCGPCKRMAKETFPNEKVGEFFNANFVCLKLDMEKPENEAFASKYPVSSYPTLMFIDETGKIVLKDVGAKSVEQILETGKKALGKNDKSLDYEKKYSEGNRDPKMLFDYVRALNAAGKPSLKITNEYLNGQQDLTTAFNLKFILEGAVEADSRVFDLLVKYQDNIAAVTSPEQVAKRVETACKNTLKKAIEFKNEALLNEAKAKMKAATNANQAQTFALDANMAYYKAVKDIDQYLQAAKTYQKLVVKNNAAKLHDLTINLIRAFPEDTKILAQAAKWAQTAAENGGLSEYWMTLAGVYKLQGDKKKARATAQKAKDALGDTESELKNKIDFFIQSLEG